MQDSEEDSAEEAAEEAEAIQSPTPVTRGRSLARQLILLESCSPRSDSLS